ncbi:MATE family efflux transporter [Alkaliphilus transvaalensis]|uniref:MATE family efflux transporter n=1 Tax=Alkaliphilus transvaalensis TaxID=114628 RepID=UPI00047B30C3|nr:MATE family efflux transporter [Alkaliphilus transvaalensis]
MNRNNNLDLLEGKISSTFLRLAMPILFAMMMQTLFNIVDTYFVSRLGTDAIAAMGLTFPIFMLSVSLGSGLSIGISSLVARSIGAGEPKKTNNVAINGLFLAGFIGVLFLCLGMVVVDPMLTFVGAEGEVFRLAWNYIMIIVIAMPIKFLFFAIDGIFRGEGKTNLSMYTLVGSSIMNIILDPLLIFGIGIFPALGIAGAALATALSWFVGLTVGIIFLLKKKSDIQIRMENFKFRWDLLLEMLQVGLPSTVAQGSIAFTMVFVNRFAMDFSQEAVAAYALGFRIDSIGILPGVAFGAATIAMLGQNFGAKKFQRMRMIYRQALVVVIVAMGIMATFVFAFPSQLLNIFLDASEGKTEIVLRHGIEYLRIMAVSYIFVGIGMVSNSAFQAIGKGLPTFITTAIRFFVLAIPLTYVLAYLVNLEITGIWIGLAISNLFFGIFSKLWFDSYYRKTYEKNNLSDS